MEIIPIIDFSSVCSSDVSSETREKLAGKVFKAMSEVGFLYIVNHGIGQEKVDAVFKKSFEFFSLPEETKKKYNVSNVQVNGYGGFTQLGKHIFNEKDSNEIRECFSVDNPERGPDVAEIPEFLSAIEELRRTCQPLVRTLLTLIGMSLKLEDPDYFLKAYNGGKLHQVPRLNRSMMRTSWYPAISDDIQVEEKSIRCSEHSDYGILTLLFQDTLGGLEVKTSDGKWIEATPLDGAIIVNTGDILQYWTGGTLPATPHRVLVPQKEIQLRSNRQSIIFLVHADDDAVVAPIKSDLIKYKEGGFKPMFFKEHYEKRMSTIYATVLTFDG